MKSNKLFLISVLLVPWFSFPFLGMKTVKRFFPTVAIITGIIFTESFLAKKFHWWIFHEKLIPNTNGEFPLIFGPFVTGAFWILKLTYGNFKRYLLTNAIAHILFIFPGIYYLQKWGIGSLLRFNRIKMYMLFFVKTFLLYFFQNITEKFRM